MKMKVLLVFTLTIVACHCRPQNLPKRIIPSDAQPISAASDSLPISLPVPRNYVPNEFERQQNIAARYEFMSDVDDHISDLTQQRQEQRDGLNVKGMYSYSDGFVKRTVHYVADEKGYRVTGMEVVPLADGPKVDLSGTASVSSAAHGTHVTYKVKSVPISGPVSKITEGEF